MADSANIAQHLPLMAERQPARAALKIPRGRSAGGDIDYLTLSFAELDAEVDAWAKRLLERGVREGDRTLVMVRQGLPLIAAAFALFKIGAIPVVIDPGMGLGSFLSCVRRSRPRVLLGIPFAQFISRVARGSFGSVSVRVTASSSPLARLRAEGEPNKTANEAGAPGRERYLVPRAPSDLAAILFTSGSTGAPKGVCYEHGMFDAQVRMIRDAYTIEPGEIDLPMLPIFALFDPALGMTAVVPELDPSKPARFDPAKIVQAVRQEQVTNSFGSPTLWGKIGEHCLERGIVLPSVKRVLCAGAPVPAGLWEKSRQFLPNGKLHSPYGATEALPVCTIASDEILALAASPSRLAGACVGRVVPGSAVKIIDADSGPSAGDGHLRELPTGEIGEIIVSGPTVTKTYDALPEATAAAKIRVLDEGGAETVWHRMGDCGYLDGDGRLWFCGRKAERITTAKGAICTEPCERVFRGLPGVVRCALVGLGAAGAQVPALVVQPTRRMSWDEEEAFALVLRDRALEFDGTKEIAQFFFHPNFPVDVRHNAKIHRLALARWASRARPHRFP